MPFGATVEGDVFQQKLEQCFGKIWQVIVIAEDIMIVGKKPNHSDHDQAITTLLEHLEDLCVIEYEKLQYKKQEVDFSGETDTTSGYKPDKNKVTAITKMLPHKQEASTVLYWMINYLSKFSARLSEIVEPTRELPKDKVPFTGAQNINLLFTDETRDCKCSHIGLLQSQTVFQTDATITVLGTCLPRRKPLTTLPTI